MIPLRLSASARLFSVVVPGMTATRLFPSVVNVFDSARIGDQEATAVEECQETEVDLLLNDRDAVVEPL